MKHGVLLDYSYRARSHVQTVIFHPESQSCVVQHRQGYSRYSQGRVVEEVEGEGQGGGRLLYAEEQDLYVGVCKYHLKVNSGLLQVGYPGNQCK